MAQPAIKILNALVTRYSTGPERITITIDRLGINECKLQLTGDVERGCGRQIAESLGPVRVDLDLAPRVRRKTEDQMDVELRCKSYFEAAHCLPDMPRGHKCRAQHGHRWEVEIAVAGVVNPRTGIMTDYYDIKRALAAVLSLVDHKNLNEAIPEAGVPTTENLCRWLWMQLHRHGLAMLCEVRLHESPDFCCVYRG